MPSEGYGRWDGGALGKPAPGTSVSPSRPLINGDPNYTCLAKLWGMLRMCEKYSAKFDRLEKIKIYYLGIFKELLLRLYNIPMKLD